MLTIRISIGIPAPDQDAGQDIPAHIVGAERMRQGRSLHGHAHIDRRIAVGGDQRCKKHQHDLDQQDDRAQHRHPVVAHLLQDLKNL